MVYFALTIKPACEFLDRLQERYKSILKAEWHISGSPEFIDDDLFDGAFSELNAQLKGTSAEKIFLVFASTYNLVESGLYPGMGYVNGQYFFEFYTKGSFEPGPLVDFFLKYDYEISFANLGSRSHYIRIFISEKFGDSKIVRIRNKFQQAARNSVRDYQWNAAELRGAYDIGLHDGFNVDTVNTHLGFVF